MAEQVKVAVRVRPFNQREQNYKSTLIIEMKGNQETDWNDTGKPISLHVKLKKYHLIERCL